MSTARDFKDATIGPFESIFADASASRVKTETGYGNLLKDGGFEAFVWAQFFGGFNRSVLGASMLYVAAQDVSVAVFAIPFLIFAGYAGQIADRFSKTHVLQAAKAFEIVLMLIATWAMVAGCSELLLAVLFLLGTQATFFSAAKYGFVPEILRDGQIPRANGLLQLTTCVVILIGTAVDNFHFAGRKASTFGTGLMLVGIAICGSIASLNIRRMPPAASADRFYWSPFQGIVEGIKKLRKQKSLTLPVCGISWFWFAGALFPANGDVQQWWALVAGAGLGGVTAGALSGDYVELALVPVGFALSGLFLVGWWSTAGHGLALLGLGLAGLGAGMSTVPLLSFLQEKAGRAEKGRILAANNFVNVAAAIAGTGVLWLLRDELHWSSGIIILALGVVMLAGSFIIMSRMPEVVVRFILWCTARVLFRIRIEGGESIPRTGSALLVANHISYADAVLVGCLTRRRTIHFMMWKPIFDVPVANYFFRILQAIPIDAASPKSTVRALRAAPLEIERRRIGRNFPGG